MRPIKQTTPAPAKPPALANSVDGNLYPLTDLPGRPWMPRKQGKPINRFTVLRWALHGKSGHKLQTLMVGGTRCTNDRWAWAFFKALTDAGDETVKPMTASARSRDHAEAEAELAAAGIK